MLGGAGCRGCVIFRFCPLHGCTVCAVACMHMCGMYLFISFSTLLCNAGCDLGNNISQRDAGRELCDLFNLCVILDCTATSHHQSTIHSAFFFFLLFLTLKIDEFSVARLVKGKKTATILFQNLVSVCR